jgi:high-affinity nickel permease
MKYLQTLFVTMLFFSVPFAVSDEIVIDTPMAATTLAFAERHASIFYTVNEDNFKVILAFPVGAVENEQLVRQSLQLADGQSYQLSIGGYGINEQASTISITRKDDHILAGVVTCETKEQMANCI